MHVISRRALTDFAARYPDAAEPLHAWYHEAKAASWENTAQLKERYPLASVINAERVVFNIGGNKYRLVVRINYGSGTVFIRFVGTHKEYDGINVATI
jgi:mRNA interferase HigB